MIFPVYSTEKSCSRKDDVITVAKEHLTALIALSCPTLTVRLFQGSSLFSRESEPDLLATFSFSGGIPITATGENLDKAAEVLMEVTVLYGEGRLAVYYQVDLTGSE